MKRLSRFRMLFLIFQMMVAVFCTNVYAFTNSLHLPNDIPSSPSAVFIPHSTLPKPLSVENKKAAYFDVHPLNLAQCIKIALERNPLTRQSWEYIRSAAAAVGQSRSDYLPSVDFTAGINRSNSVSDSRQTGPANSFDAGFGLSYLLFDGMARSAKLKGAKAALLEVEFQHNTTLQNLILKVEEAYYRLLAAKELKRVAAETVKQAQYHLNLAIARYRNGLVAKPDLLKAKSERAEAKLQLVQADSEIQLARGQLANSMGLNPSEPIDIKKIPQNQEQLVLSNIKQLMKNAVRNRPELKAALAGLESKQAKIAYTKSLYWPKIRLNTDYGWKDKEFLPKRDEWSVGVSISWPLFDGFNRKYTVRKAESDFAGSVSRYKKLLRDVELEVWTAYSQVIDANQTIKAARRFVASADESARASEEEYKNGTASIIDVIDTQTVRTTANVRMVQAKLNWHIAIARLKRALGQTFTNKTVQ